MSIADEPNSLTLARRAVLDAVNHSDFLADPTTETGRAFVQIFDGEETNHLIPDTGEPALGELPALDLRWSSSISPAWQTNREMTARCVLELKIYSHGNNLVDGERLLFRTMRAVFLCGPTAEDGEQTFITNATGQPPTLLPFQPPQVVRVGPEKKLLATLTILRIGLDIQFDPFAREQ